MIFWWFNLAVISYLLFHAARAAVHAYGKAKKVVETPDYDRIAKLELAEYGKVLTRPPKKPNTVRVRKLPLTSETRGYWKWVVECNRSGQWETIDRVSSQWRAFRLAELHLREHASFEEARRRGDVVVRSVPR